MSDVVCHGNNRNIRCFPAATDWYNHVSQSVVHSGNNTPTISPYGKHMNIYICKLYEQAVFTDFIGHAQ